MPFKFHQAGGGGGGGTVSDIVSTDFSVNITNPTGPIVDLSVPSSITEITSTSGNVTITNPTGPVVDLDVPNELPTATCDGEYLINDSGAWVAHGEKKVRLGCSGVASLSAPDNTIAIGADSALSSCNLTAGHIAIAASNTQRMDIADNRILIQSNPAPFGGTVIEPDAPGVPNPVIALVADNLELRIDQKTWNGPTMLGSSISNAYAKKSVHIWLKDKLYRNNADLIWTHDQSLNLPNTTTNVNLQTLPNIFFGSGSYWNVTTECQYIFTDDMIVTCALNLVVGRQSPGTCTVEVGLESSTGLTIPVYGIQRFALPRYRLPAQTGETTTCRVEFSTQFSTLTSVNPYIKLITPGTNVQVNVLSCHLSLR